ncbi:hypothetical protein D3C87_2058540 [compost metagenome]
MVAKPGAFCEAIVTRKNGRPILISVVKVNFGAINSGITTLKARLSVTTSPPAQAVTLPTNRVATMA